MTTHIIVSDDHPLVRSAITNLLNRLDQDIKISEADDFKSLNTILENSATLASLVLLDLKLPDTTGLEGLLTLKKSYPALPVAIVSAYDDNTIINNAMQYGACGFIPKSLDNQEMGRAILSILEGDLWFPQIDDEDFDDGIDFNKLTSTQLRVLNLLVQGKPNKEMASILEVTEATIKAHLTEIFRKLNVSSRTQAIVVAKQLEIPETL